MFFYYLRELHGDTDGRASLVGKAMLVLTVAAVVYGFILRAVFATAATLVVFALFWFIEHRIVNSK